MKLRIVRRTAWMNTIPPEQAIVEIFNSRGRLLATMGRWSTLCLPEGSIKATEATDEQVIRAFTVDESVFA